MLKRFLFLCISCQCNQNYISKYGFVMLWTAIEVLVMFVLTQANQQSYCIIQISLIQNLNSIQSCISLVKYNTAKWKFSSFQVKPERSFQAGVLRHESFQDISFYISISCVGVNC